jgi:hypothetical protein
MTRNELLKGLDASALPRITAALDEMDRLRIEYCLIEGRRPLLTQCLYALQGRLGDIPPADLAWACKQAGIRPPGGSAITKTLRSRHLDGKAVDIVPVRDGTALWTYSGNEAAFGAIATVMKKHGFIWGGDWQWKDYPHYEL